MAATGALQADGVQSTVVTNLPTSGATPDGVAENEEVAALTPEQIKMQRY